MTPGAGAATGVGDGTGRGRLWCTQMLTRKAAASMTRVIHYNRTCLERACPKELLKRNGSVYQSEIISDCSEAATCSKRAIVRRSVVPRERLWERPWKVR